MKSLKIWSLVVLLALAMTACEKKPNNNSGNNNNNIEVNGFDNIEQEWKLVSVNGTPNEFNVYIKFQSGMFAMYQQVYTLDYKFFEGEYKVDGDTLSGNYFDSGEWRCDYTGGITQDGKTMTLKSNEAHPVTCVYEVCTIPEEVKNEATTRSLDVVPFL